MNRAPSGLLFNTLWFLHGLVGLSIAYQAIYMVYPTFLKSGTIGDFWDRVAATPGYPHWLPALFVSLLPMSLAFNGSQLVSHLAMSTLKCTRIDIPAYFIVTAWVFQLLRSLSLIGLFSIVNWLAWQNHIWHPYAYQWPLAVVTLTYSAAEVTGMFLLMKSYAITWEERAPRGYSPV